MLQIKNNQKNMRKNIVFIILIIGAIYSLKAQTQTQDLNMGLHQLQFPSANGGFNRIHSFGGTFPGKWLFKSRFDDIYLDAGENSGNRYRILFLSGGIERARMNGDGKFGIGTSNPIEKLHVEGSLLLDAYQSGNQKGLFFREGFSATNKYNLSILTYDDGDNSPDALDINAYDGIYFNTGSNSRNPRMTIKGNGNVGIGTTDPLSKLTVSGHVNIGGEGNYRLRTRHIDGKDYQSRALGSLYLNYNTGNHVLVGFGGQDSNFYASGNVGIGTTNPSAKLDVVGVIKTSHQDGRYVNLFTSGDGNSYINIAGGSETSRFGFQVDGSSKMSIMKDGTVGIGTNNTQGYKLGVKGKIAAEEVKVALYNGWPDYVFKEDYNLPTLQEVEQHISENGHLENIPSAAEVAENGIQLGEMNKKLLEKIEQLTLYMIEQNKKTDFLLKEVETLKKKNATLEARLK